MSGTRAQQISLLGPFVFSGEIMPWSVVGNHSECGESEPFAVVKDSDGSVVGCHPNRDAANQQLAALNASEAEPFFLEAEIQPGDGPTGRAWAVTIIGPAGPDGLITVGDREFIRSKNGRLYAVEGLAANADKFDGAKVYDNHLTAEEFEKKQGMRSVADEWVGTIVQPKFDQATKAIKAVFKVVDEALANKLKSAFEAGVLSTIGLSIDTFPIVNSTAVVEGKQLPIIEGFKKILSVDLVAEPAAGGGFNRLLAAQNITGENDMSPDELKEMVQKTISDTLPGLVAETLAAADQAKQEAEEPEVEAQAEEPVEASVEEPEAEEPEAEPRAEELTTEARLKKLELANRLAEAKLAPGLSDLVITAFGDRDYDEPALERFIKQAKQAQAAADTTGRVKENGTARGLIKVGMNEQDTFQSELLRLFMGNTKFKGLQHVKDDFVVERIPEGYTAWVNSGQQRGNYYYPSELFRDLLGGDPFTNQRAYEAVTTSSMSSIVKNAMNVMLAASYAQRHRWWEPIVRTEEVDTIDQATLVRTYGLDNLDVVNEGAAYTESTWADEEETAAFVKRGNFVGVTLESLMRDKLNEIRTLPDRLAAAWFNTISALVSGVFTVNSAAGPVLADTGALFNATAVTTAGGHANLLTTAFGSDTTAYEAARLAMRKQTDSTLGTGNRLGIRPNFILVPYDLEVAASAVINSEMKPGSANNDPNPVFRESSVIGVPEWTDTDNWALVADPGQWPAIWLIFLTGNQVPQIFTADSETGGSMFTNDTLRYKVRMLTYRFSSTYDCAPVSDFRPLHKSNV